MRPVGLGAAWLAALLVTLAASGGASGQVGDAPLPEPLTLELALSLADSDHPDLSVVAARLASRKSNQAAAAALTAIPSRFDADDRADEMRMLHARQHRREKILRCYLGVLRSDFKFTRSNEAMAIAYVRMDRGAHKNRLGQVSDITLAEQQSHYQLMRRKRYAAQAEQRASRSRLALALNRPGQLSSLLAIPPMTGNDAKRPALEELEARALEHNTRLHAIRYRIEAATQRLAAAGEAADALPGSPTDGDTSTSGEAISRRQIVTAAIARREAELARLQGRFEEVQLRVRQAMLDAWLRLETLYAARDEALVYSDYRDLYLDRSRALYEQLVSVDLGDAMVHTSEAALRSAGTEFDIALTWARIGLLTGQAPDEMTASMLGNIP